MSVYPIDERGTFWAIEPDMHGVEDEEEEPEMDMKEAQENGANGVPRAHIITDQYEPVPPAADCVPVVSREEIIDTLQFAEVAVRTALAMLNVAIERAVGDEKMQQAAVWDSRAALLRHSAQMLGLTATDIRQVL